jgi:hypothetical protein
MTSSTLRPRSWTNSDAAFSRPQKELQPSGALAAGPDFAAEEIALRDDTDKSAGVVHDGEATDTGPQHDFCCFLDRGVRRDRDDVLS